MIFCHSKTQLLTMLSMWKGDLSDSFKIFFFFLKKKNCHVGKSGQELCLWVAMYHISNFIELNLEKILKSKFKVQ